MDKDPLKPEPVGPLVEPPTDGPTTHDDCRPFWLRLMHSLRPTASVEIDKKTGKPVETVGIEGKVDL